MNVTANESLEKSFYFKTLPYLEASQKQFLCHHVQRFRKDAKTKIQRWKILEVPLFITWKASLSSLNISLKTKITYS